MSVDRERILLLSGIVVSALLFIMLAFTFEEALLLDADYRLQSYLYDPLGPVTDFIFIVITYIGSAYLSFPVMGILLGVFLVQKRYWTALLLLFNLIGVRQLNWFLKSVFERPRPELQHLVHVSSESFPSGHSMNSIAFIGFLAYLLYVKLKDAERSALWVFGSAVVLIGLIGLSRIYLGVHYPSDVIGGFLAGGAWLLLSILLYTYIPERERID